MTRQTIPFATFVLILFAAFGSMTAAPQSKKGSDPTKTATLHVHFIDAAGHPVTDLRREEIKILDNGKELPMARFLDPSLPFDVGLLLDVSPSVHRIVDAIQDGTSRLFHSFPEESEELLITFDSQVYVDCDWTADRKRMDEAIFELGLHKPGSKSIIFEALAVTLEQKFVERGPRHALILFTDGVEIGSDGIKAAESLEVVRESDVLVFVIQSDSRAHYRQVHGGPTAYDPTRTIDPPGTTGTSVGGIFVGSGSSERDMAEYKVQKTFERASKYMTNVSLSGRGPLAMLVKGEHLPAIYNDILEDLNDLYTITVLPPKRDHRFHTVSVQTTRKGVVALPLTKGYWAY